MGAEGQDGTLTREFRAEEDAAEVTRILSATPEATLWSKQDLLKMVELSGVTAFVSVTDGGPTGIVIGRRVGDEAEILNLAVRLENRRRGEGKKLIGKLLEEYRRLGVSHVFLEVRESNASAITFYGQWGFHATGRRKGYYQEPKEDALVMELRL
jgi:ribosomal-protein-alanine acetyltransferase